MTVESVRQFFADLGEPVQIIELEVSTATVALAAQAHGVEPGRIAKTLAFRLAGGSEVLLVARGDARIDNRKFKDAFGKGKMLPPDEVAHITGHPVGGVCPFGLARPLPVRLDVSLQAFDEVLPAAGSVNSALRISPGRMAELTCGSWVDVCQPAQVQTGSPQYPQ
jgi:prolyl-tRNA editing enzyme YbaK/EbsC (Cys-tRNA(Pro) deacylase)